MERINGRIAVAYVPKDPYTKMSVRQMPDSALKKEVCKDIKRCSGCVSYRVCEFGKEAVRRGLRK